MARKPTLSGDYEMTENVMKVKQLQRVIAKDLSGMQHGALSIEQVDALLSSWFDKGYKLFNTHYIGESPDGYSMIYVLVLAE